MGGVFISAGPNLMYIIDILLIDQISDSLREHIHEIWLKYEMNLVCHY